MPSNRSIIFFLKLLLLFQLFATTIAVALAVLCAADGSSATYSETLDTTNNIRRIVSSGCPNHYASDSTPNRASDQSNTIEMPLIPCFATQTTNTLCTPGGIGVALNGVAIFGPSAGNPTDMCSDAVVAEGDTFNYCGGHAQQQGVYHYHIPPSCLLAFMEDASYTQMQMHSKHIGYAYDGFPIYGPMGVTGNTMAGCAHQSLDHSDCLDACNGHAQHVIDGYLYHYHIAGPVSDLDASSIAAKNAVDPYPDSDYYPYTIGCFVGGLANTDCATPGDGVEDGFVAAANEGITTVYGSNVTDSESDAARILCCMHCHAIFIFVVPLVYYCL